MQICAMEKVPLWLGLALLQGLVRLSLGQFYPHSECAKFCVNGAMQCSFNDFFLCTGLKNRGVCDCTTNPPTSLLPPPPPGANDCVKYCNLDCSKFPTFSDDQNNCNGIGSKCYCNQSPPKPMPPPRPPANDCEKYCNKNCRDFSVFEWDKCGKIDDRCDCSANPPKPRGGFAGYDDETKGLIIGGSLIGGLVLIGIIICAVICCLMTNRRRAPQLAPSNWSTAQTAQTAQPPAAAKQPPPPSYHYPSKDAEAESGSDHDLNNPKYDMYLPKSGYNSEPESPKYDLYLPKR